MWRIPCLMLLIGCCISNVFGQNLFQKEYGGLLVENGYSGEPTFDGGYLLYGITGSYGAGDYDVYLIKINSFGDTLWTRVYGSLNREFPESSQSARQTSDSGFIAVTSIQDSLSNYFACAIRTNANGDLIWVNTYHPPNYESSAGDARETFDGGFIIAGIAYGYYLIKTDSMGDALWSTTYRINGYKSLLYEIVETADSGFIMVGSVYDSNQNDDYQDILVVKTNASGNLQWAKRYEGQNKDVGTSIVETSDGGYMIGGFTSSFGAGSTDALLIKITSTGDTLWTRTFGGTGLEFQTDMVQTPDNGYVFVGSTLSFGNCTYLVKTDQNGDTSWTKSFGNPNTRSESIALTPDGGYFIVGSNFISSSIMVAKTDSLGYSGCSLNPTSTVVSSAPFQVIDQNLTVNTWNMIDSVPQYLMARDGMQSTLCCVITSPITISGAVDFCEGDSVELTTDTIINTYYWNTGDSSRSITVTQAGNYFVTVTDASGCTATSNSVFVNSFPLPNVSLSSLPDTVCSDWAAIVLNGSPVGGIFSGPGVTDSIFNPASANMGVNQVVYSYTDSLGCTSSDTESVVIDICLGINNEGKAGFILINKYSSKATVILPAMSKHAVLDIYDVTGKLIFRKHLTSAHTEIDLENISEGFYIARVSNFEFSKTQRLVIAGQ